jgi:hypothetical protein
MISPITAMRAAVALGPQAIVDYGKYRAGLASGWLRSRTPITPWSSIETEPGVAPQPGLIVDRPARSWDERPWSEFARKQALIVGEEILQGRLRLFGMKSMTHVGFPPGWDTFAAVDNRRDATTVALDRHWTEYEPNSMSDDIKLLWETSRFGWAMDLARAYAWTGAGRFVEGFALGLRSWMRSNRPNAGPHWQSAQEAALRLLAVVFAHEVMSAALTADIRADLARFIVAHARRLPHTLAYSSAQGNNHLLAEAAALLTAGKVLPMWPEAAGWRKLGRRLLDRGLKRQIGDDGSYVQHSHNYARLALELGVWAVKMGEATPARDRLIRMAELLKHMLNDDGRVPNFGPNDGAHLLPLSACGYADYRPVIQLAAAVLGTGQGLEPGPWDELCAWFGVRPSHEEGSNGVSLERKSKSFDQAGLHMMEGEASRAVVRAASFRSRPGHSDQLHFDMWWRGRNLASDAGTYLYNGPNPWKNSLAVAVAHNNVVINGQEPMERVGTFLWLRWSRARLLWRRVSVDGNLEAAAFSHDGYQHLGFMQRRTVVRIGGGLWLVVDDVCGEGDLDLTLGWALPDAPWRTEGSHLTIALDEGSVDLGVELEDCSSALYRSGAVVHGEPVDGEQATRGWYSPTYAVREPALHWVHHAQGLSAPTQVRSWWACGPVRWQDVAVDWEVEWGAIPKLTSVSSGDSVLEL